MKFLVQLIVSAIAVIVTSLVLPGVQIDNPVTAIIVAAVLAFLNAILKPLLVVLTIPISILTLGLFLLVINALIILLAAKIVPGFTVSGFWAALFFSIILTLITSLFNSFGAKEEDE
jgi:putative membrane protein